jgi:YD repeat-containing protein
MTLNQSFLFISLFFTITAWGQEVIRQSIPMRSSTKTYDSTIYDVNGYRTHENILTLFRPEELVLSYKHDPTISQEIFIMGIEVLDTTHIGLRYLKYKASIDIGNKNFAHGMLPRGIHRNMITEMQYIESVGHKSDVLVLVLSRDADASRQRLKYKTQSQRIRWFDVDGKIMTQQEMSDLNLQPGEFESELIAGKEAAEKYGDPKYAEGVQVLRKAKKND